MSARVWAIISLLAAGLPGGGCTDLSLSGDEQLSCTANADCPAGLLCAAALGRCVDEAVVAETPITVEGEATVDAPRISRVEGFARAVVTVTFSKVPTGDATALVDNRLPIPCETDDSGSLTWRCAFDARAFPDEQDGAYDIVVVGTDAAGNEARARARVELDTEAPAVAPDSVAILYAVADGSLVRDVRALGVATSVSVQLSLTETTATTPTLAVTNGNNRVAMAHLDARSIGPLHVFAVAGVDVSGLPDGDHALELDVVDDVGNADAIDLGANVTIDTTAPAAPVVDVADRIVYRRTPWGTRAEPEPQFRLVGVADAAEPGGTLVVTSAESLTSTQLATTPNGDDGSFDAVLQVIDVPRVFVRVVDGAGNVGPVARVRDIVWTASLGGRRRSDAFSNPHALFSAPTFDDTALQPNVVTEPLRAGDLVDGDGIVVDAIAHRRDVRTDIQNQPKRMSMGMAYLPTIGAPVVLGGIPDRNRTQVTDTFVFRNDHWVGTLNNPSASGPLAYDTVNLELVALVANGETWAFDGDTWRQRPVDRIPTMRRGPIAWDPVDERLVTVQGTETWVLGRDEIWQRLDSDAPIAGLPMFDGLDNNGVGAVIGFDGVDGQIVLYGQEPAGTGAVYGLVDDVWTRLGDAPASLASTALEDLETGRVHFVCRTVSGAGTNGTMLTWDGAVMQAGPVNTEPNSGCGAAYDLARHRLMVLGGTGDSLPNVQALPQRTVATLDVGAATWRVDFDNPPLPLRHNSGGVAHFNPILNRIMMRGAATGANLSRTTTLWDGTNVTAANTSPISFGPPFFDGLNSRFVEGNSEQTFVGNGWVSRTMRSPPKPPGPSTRTPAPPWASLASSTARPRPSACAAIHSRFCRCRRRRQPVASRPWPGMPQAIARCSLVA